MVLDLNIIFVVYLMFTGMTNTTSTAVFFVIMSIVNEVYTSFIFNFFAVSWQCKAFSVWVLVYVKLVPKQFWWFGHQLPLIKFAFIIPNEQAGRLILCNHDSSDPTIKMRKLTEFCVCIVYDMSLIIYHCLKVSSLHLKM